MCPLFIYIRCLLNVLKADLIADSGITKLSIEISLIFFFFSPIDPVQLTLNLLTVLYCLLGQAAMAGHDSGSQHQFTGFQKYFNSYTITGRRNVCIMYINFCHVIPWCFLGFRLKLHLTFVFSSM